jgi:hypothetical protein
MLDPRLFVAHSIYSNKGVYALFLGSGISRSTGISTGWDIVIDLIRRVARLQGEDCTNDPSKWFADYFKEAPDYSNILEKLTNSAEERLNLLKPYIEPNEEELEKGLKQPSRAHSYIAQLVKKGYIKVIVTTNFDRLMENALRTIGIEPTVISNPAHIEHSMPLIHSPITVIKIHGDYLDTKLLNIKSELEHYDERLVRLLTPIFEDFGLITCGWSAQWDIALVQLLKSSNKFRFGNFFMHMGKPTNELEQLAHYRKGQLLQIKGADDFFSEVNENIDALERFAVHPLSKELNVSRFKKYISSEIYRVQLNDLLAEELASAFNKINNDVDISKPTFDNIKANLDFYLLSIDTLVALLIEGVYWGKELHHDIWLNGIIKIAYPKQKATSYWLWGTLQYFPSVILIYSVGITALLRKDFLLLGKLFGIKTINKGSQDRKSIIYNSNPGSLIEPDDLNKALKKNHYVPMNELIYHSLLPAFDALVPTEEEYDDLFDYYEIIQALFYLKMEGLPGFPVGRFKWRRYPFQLFDQLHKAIQEQKSDHELIKCGLFSSYEELNVFYNHLIQRTTTSM